MLRDKHTSHELIKFNDRGDRYLYSYEYSRRDASKGKLYRLDLSTRTRLPNSHESELDDGMWYVYAPSGEVIDTLDSSYFDQGDVAFILARLDVTRLKSEDDSNFIESIYDNLKKSGNLNEMYIWSVQLSDDDVHDFQGDSEDEIRDKITQYCLDNDLTLIQLLNVKHVRKDRFIDPEQLRSIQENYSDYELSWVERTRADRNVMKTRGFASMDDLNKFRSTIEAHPRFVRFLTIMEPDGTSYIQEGKDLCLLKTSRSGRYKMYRDDRDGTLKVLDDKTHTYVNSDLSAEEDFESWEDD